eukprot:5253036-Pleurochrysis_carterae.AAC.5
MHLDKVWGYASHGPVFAEVCLHAISTFLWTTAANGTTHQPADACLLLCSVSGCYLKQVWKLSSFPPIAFARAAPASPATISTLWRALRRLATRASAAIAESAKRPSPTGRTTAPSATGERLGPHPARDLEHACVRLSHTKPKLSSRKPHMRTMSPILTPPPNPLTNSQEDALLRLQAAA